MSETLVIIDYGSGNLRSAAKAFARAATDLADPPSIHVSADAELVGRADRIVLPGVGAFADCRQGLYAIPGMVAALERRVIEAGVPFFGICVGMQLMASEGREKTVTEGLGWIPGAVTRIAPAGGLKVPHMGWNTLAWSRTHPLFAGIPDGPGGLHAYFVHSYQFEPAAAGMQLATVDYGGTITAAVGRDNLFGTQFHPEKSQTLGLQLIRNFLGWKP